MKKLFIFYLGGKSGKSNIELHDVFFGVGEKAQDCYELIKAHWFGDLQGLHVDCYAPVEYIDGYDIIITENDKKLQEQEDKELFFLNLGAYQSDLLEEQHYFEMVVADNISDAKLKAKSMIEAKKKINLLHTDNIFSIDNILIPSELIESNYSLQLIPSETSKPLVYTHGYFLID